MKNVLVTGGAGYVGAHTCKFLKKQGYNPIVFDNFIYGHKSAIKWGEYISGDLTSYQDINNALAKIKPLAVVHCAGLTYVGESVLQPALYYQVNIVGSLNLLNAMIANKLNNIVFSSSCATYGDVQDKAIIDDVTVQAPISAYGNTKFIFELILKDFQKAYGLNHIIVRYFNVAGADPEGEIGEYHEPETHLIPLVIDVALGKQDNIKIFGTNYPTADGTCIRDYIHVDDIANAHFLSLEYLLKNKSSNAFNIGTETGYSVAEIIKAVEFVSQKNIKAINVEPRLGDPAILVANSAKANKYLNWRAEYTDIKAIIKTAYNWHLKLQQSKSLKK